MKEYRKADIVLSYVNTKGKNENIGLNDIAEGCNSLTKMEIGQILEYLKNRDLIKVYDLKSNEKTYEYDYMANFSGIIFEETGGFEREFKVAKRQRQATCISDYFIIILKPLALVGGLAGLLLTSIKIYEFFAKCN